MPLGLLKALRAICFSITVIAKHRRLRRAAPESSTIFCIAPPNTEYSTSYSIAFSRRHLAQGYPSTHQKVKGSFVSYIPSPSSVYWLAMNRRPWTSLRRNRCVIPPPSNTCLRDSPTLIRRTYPPHISRIRKRGTSCFSFRLLSLDYLTVCSIRAHLLVR